MRTISIVWAVLAACSPVEQPGVEQGDGREVVVAPLAGMETQGQHLLGALVDDAGPDPVYHLSTTTRAVTASGEAIDVAFSGHASLASGDHVGIDPFLDGIVLDVEGGGELQLTISRGGSDITLYHLAFRATPADAFVDPCQGEEAVPLAGRWQRTGLHEADPSHISFSCGGAVGFKCTLWGYLAGADPADLGWRAHQACTRMARADYCADGTSHTRDGTHITIYDRVGVALPVPAVFEGLAHWPPPPGATTFEAAWNDGDHEAQCLSRVRWQSLPLGGVCGPDKLRDPRVDSAIRFCDDVQVAQDQRPLLFDESRFVDLELYGWQFGDDRVSTVRGYYDPSGTFPDREPFPQVGTYTMVARDGMLLRSFPDGADMTAFHAVHLFTKAGDAVIARASDPPPGYTDQAPEGFVLKAKAPGTVAFDLYRNTVTGDLLSTTLPPPADYVLVGNVGFVPPAPEDQGASAQIRNPAHH